MTDKIKLALAGIVLVAALVAFYLLGDYALWMRVLMLLAAAGVTIAIAMQTELGRAGLVFFKESQVEVRKVVWPTRKETTQTTLIVLVMVLAMGIMLWLLDVGLLWAVKLLTGQGG